MSPSHRVPDLEELLQHSGWVRNLAFACIRDHDLAEDVSQAVLIKALEGPRRSGRVLRAWLAAVTRNMARNEVRGRARRRLREQRAAQPEGVGGREEEADQDGIIRAHGAITQALESMTQPHRQIIALRFYEERSFEEIAASLGISVGNARVRLHRALKEMRERLEEHSGDWRASCALTLPLALRARTLSPSLATLGISVLLVGVLWTAMDWGGSASSAATRGGDQGTRIGLEDQDGAVEVTGLGNAGRVPLTSPARLDGSSQVVADHFTGRVFHDGDPVAGAQIKIWQAGEFSYTSTDADGFFELEVSQGEYAIVGASFNGMARMERVDRGRKTFPRIDLLKPKADGVRVFVRDGITKGLIPGASVKVYVDWSGGFWGMHVRENAFELVAEGVTDAQGGFVAPGWLADMKLVLEGEAEGFLPNLASIWQAGRSVPLLPGNQLPVQLVYLDGSPVADVELRQGMLVRQLERTDEKGFIPPSDQWSEATRTSEMDALPTELALRLPDGRIWRHACYSLTDDLILVQEDRIRITVDTRPVRAQLIDAPLPEGGWVEARAANTGLPSLLPEDADSIWQRLEAGAVVDLDRGWAGDIRRVQARLMPGRIPMGEFEVVERLATVSPQTTHLTMTLAGDAVDQGHELTLVLESSIRKVRGMEIPVLHGIAESEIPFRPFCRFTGRIEDHSTGEQLLLQNDHNQISPRFIFDPAGGAHSLSLRVLENRRLTVSIRVDGIPVVGGKVGSSSIDSQGNCSIPFDLDGKPLLDSVRLQLAADLHRRSGGPILSTFSFRGDREIPGRFHPRSDGSWTWDLDLAQVELLAPSMKGHGPFPVYPTFGGINTTVRWPITRNDGSFAWGLLKSPAEGGSVRFRVPAGRYAFSIGGQVHFGGPDGTEMPAGILTSLAPDSVDTQSDDGQGDSSPGQGASTPATPSGG